MPRYYFDLREDGELAVDEEGLELPTLQAVQIEAARSLVDMARHAVWQKPKQSLVTGCQSRSATTMALCYRPGSPLS
jgi:hypothetical protein